jgi:ribosomal protein S12 methylthiotransferase
MAKDKFLYIENLGCAKNQVDAEVLSHNLEKDGWTLTEDVKDASLIIVNTCGFIESAREESIDAFFSLREQNPKAKIIVSGCLAQRYAQDLESQLPEANGVFGNRDLAQINTFVKEVETQPKSIKNKPVILTPEYPDPDAESDERNKLFNFPGSAYLKISEGCNHRCGYCAIPLIRGNLRSRPKEAILTEAKRLLSTGIKEINLIAQDLAAYGTDWDGQSHFCKLLQDITNLDGDFKVRMLYIHPDAFPMELIDLVKNNKKIIPYFDIPFQHASPKLLVPMKRTGNRLVYEQLIDTIRKELPQCVIRTTIMFGFPGDSKEDFDEVYKFVEHCRFNWMGSFLYSREEGTYAWDLTTEEEHKALIKKAKTWQKKLQNLQEKISSQKLEEFVGQECEVLIEELIEGEDLAIGRIWAQAPEVDGLTVVMGRDMVPGQVYKCGIRKVNGIDLEAVKI